MTITPAAQAFDVDALAQEIRRIDGSHRLGAGALAEALAPYIAALTSQAGGGAVAWLHDVVQDDGAHDQALSFSPESFPLQGVGGFRSVSHTPLYAVPPAPAATAFDEAVALEHFSEYFRTNYPGPDTIIGKPDWHSPKIFRAAMYAIKAATQPEPAPDTERAGVAEWIVNLRKELSRSAWRRPTCARTRTANRSKKRNGTA